MKKQTKGTWQNFEDSQPSALSINGYEKFTKGNWYVKNAEPRPNELSGVMQQFIYNTRLTGSNRISAICFGRNSEEAQANAALIAAAPKMYAALKEAKQSLSILLPDPEQSFLFNTITSILQKANPK
jgi:hypothetical protein